MGTIVYETFLIKAKRRVPTLNRLQLEAISRQYFENEGELQHYELLANGAINTTYKIYWSNEPYVLRLYIRDSRSASIEKKLYDTLSESVPMPELLFTSSDSYPFALFRFCEHKHIYEIHQKYAAQLCYDLGKTLAAIHSYHFEQAGLFGKNLEIETVFEKGSSPYFEYCLEHLTRGSLAWQRLGEPLAVQVLNFMSEHKEFFPTIQNGGCLVHSDFKPVNLLWDEQKGLTVLDWEFAHSGNGIIDFGILLRHHADFPLHLDLLKKGYTENGGSLPADWVKQARITDYINVVQLLSNEKSKPTIIKQLRKSALYTIENWESLHVPNER